MPKRKFDSLGEMGGLGGAMVASDPNKNVES